jgi:chloramphenicol 3-O-phosphotransferase
METHGTQRTPGRRAYRIVVGAEIGERFAAAFEGMEVTSTRGRTVITGDVIDQSHLHGILDRINALGLELVSVQPVPEESQSATR